MKVQLELTPTQKKEVYKRAIKVMEKAVKNNNIMGLCWCISGAVHDLKYGEGIEDVAYGSNMKHSFPEVYKFKPKIREWHSCHYWFPCNEEGMQKRIDILQKAIIKVEKLEKLCNLLSS